ncbi:MAG: hypothetical protein DWQ07_14335 [Chloroflexi bacterium]|nr:MAG: hypothetical protein DWQ07_14335 [Chloroflexota bacterium]MBL1195738.1 hypothetical protein [Chloroflexota bacterium]NOH13027.1 hypothetical protein [Chloroflexota bacterium]
MKFNVLDTYSTYQKLLGADNAEARQSIFDEELVKPFEGLIQVMGGGDPQTFKQWGMWPEQFDSENGPTMAARIKKLAEHNAWQKAADALKDGKAAFVDYLEHIPTEVITFGLMVIEMGNVPLERGYSGFGAIPGYIMTVYGEPNAYNLARLKGATAHELHHNILAAAKPETPMISNVGTYMIAEGLAESFAKELYGEDVLGYYVTEITDAEIETAKQKIHDALWVSGFNEVRKYIFGDTIMGSEDGIPDFAGYAIGYRVVQAYLQKTGKSVVEATFVAHEELIAESGYFD